MLSSSVGPYCCLTSAGSPGRARRGRARCRRGGRRRTGAPGCRTSSDSRVEVDLLVLLAGRRVDVVVAPVDGRVDAAHVVDGGLEVVEVDHHHVVDRQALSRCLIVETSVGSRRSRARSSSGSSRPRSGESIVTSSSRGIDIIEIHGLPGSNRTSSISFECGSTGAVGGVGALVVTERAGASADRRTPTGASARGATVSALLKLEIAGHAS